jgi:hypothetical protein
MKNTLLALALILGILPLAHAQSDLKQRTKTFRNSKRFAIEYDKFKDETLAHVGPFAISSKGGMVGLYGRFLFRGQSVQTPVETFYLGIIRYGRQWQFLDTDKVYILVDGERYALDAARGSRLGNSRAYLTEEWLTVPIDFRLFQKLGTAKSAELKAGSIEAKLKDEHLEAFRDLLSLARP